MDWIALRDFFAELHSILMLVHHPLENQFPELTDCCIAGLA
jgi:hypothetical protein